MLSRSILFTTFLTVFSICTAVNAQASSAYEGGREVGTYTVYASLAAVALWFAVKLFTSYRTGDK